MENKNCYKIKILQENEMLQELGGSTYILWAGETLAAITYKRVQI